jgi:hypothetical protein
MKESCNAEGRHERVYSDAKVASLVVFISLYIQLRAGSSSKPLGIVNQFYFPHYRGRLYHSSED